MGQVICPSLSLYQYLKVRMWSSSRDRRGVLLSAWRVFRFCPGRWLYHAMAAMVLAVLSCIAMRFRQKWKRSVRAYRVVRDVIALWNQQILGHRVNYFGRDRTS
ncbi:hypothetical protein BR93DRAFT_548793 [Coniochaeta sp. PMI_546]|nr:hypothetical protein BR93DRAFT_548793 [Coniochaeta sp. PMI_546]